MKRHPDQLLRSVSRSFYLSLRFLPGEMRETVSLAYLLARFSDTVADTPGLPENDRVALLEDFGRVLDGGGSEFTLPGSAFAASLDHPGEGRLVAGIGETLSRFHALPQPDRDLVREVLLTILEGQQWDLAAFAATPVPCAEAGDLLRYAHRVAGSVGEFWTRLAAARLGPRFADPDKIPKMLAQGRKLGQALQLVNILRDLHEDFPRGRCYLPADELRAAGWTGEDLPSPGVVAPVFDHWLATCRDFLAEGEAYAISVRDARLRFCTRLPRILAEETALLLQRAGAHRVLRERIKVSRRVVWSSASRAFFF